LSKQDLSNLNDLTEVQIKNMMSTLFQEAFNGEGNATVKACLAAVNSVKNSWFSTPNPKKAVINFFAKAEEDVKVLTENSIGKKLVKHWGEFTTDKLTAHIDCDKRGFYLLAAKEFNIEVLDADNIDTINTKIIEALNKASSDKANDFVIKMEAIYNIVENISKVDSVNDRVGLEISEAEDKVEAFKMAIYKALKEGSKTIASLEIPTWSIIKRYRKPKFEREISRLDKIALSITAMMHGDQNIIIDGAEVSIKAYIEESKLDGNHIFANPAVNARVLTGGLKTKLGISGNPFSTYCSDIATYKKPQEVFELIRESLIKILVATLPGDSRRANRENDSNGEACFLNYVIGEFSGKDISKMNDDFVSGSERKLEEMARDFMSRTKENIKVFIKETGAGLAGDLKFSLGIRRVGSGPKQRPKSAAVIRAPRTALQEKIARTNEGYRQQKQPEGDNFLKTQFSRSQEFRGQDGHSFDVTQQGKTGKGQPGTPLADKISPRTPARRQPAPSVDSKGVSERRPQGGQSPRSRAGSQGGTPPGSPRGGFAAPTNSSGRKVSPRKL